MQRGYRLGVGMRAYANAKLANLLTVYEFARRLQDVQITINAVHPGYVATNILPFEDAIGFVRLLKPLWGVAKRFIQTPEQGAAAAVYLACSPRVGSQSGGYFEGFAAVASCRMSHDRSLQKKMWLVSQKLIQGK